MTAMKASPSLPCEGTIDRLEDGLQGLACLLGAGDERRGRRLASLRQRLQARQFRLAVLGQFKRGKSTLINALLGASFLPVGVLPLTAVPIYISWSAQARTRAAFGDGDRWEETLVTDPAAIRAFITVFASEEANPKNERNVARVDLHVPSPLLAGGIVLVDTPGIGSTLQHNTDTALSALSDCDAALFVASVDPPITEAEISYLRAIKANMPRILFALNKIDYAPPGEQDKIAGFFRKTLKENGLWASDSVLFNVSALKALQTSHASAARSDPHGVGQLKRYILDDLGRSKATLLQDAIARKAGEIVAESVAELQLGIRARQLPLDDLTSRCASFEKSVNQFERQHRIVHDLLKGEQRRLHDTLEQKIEELRASARSRLEAMATLLAASESNQVAIDDSVRAMFDAAREELTRVFTEAFAAVAANHADGIDRLIGEVRGTADTLFEASFPPLPQPEGFSLGIDPYWVTDPERPTLLPTAPTFLDQVLPARMRDRRRHGRIVKKLDDLIVRNAENLRWAILRGIDESFRHLALYVDTQLSDALKTTNGVVQEALVRRTSSAAATESEIAALQEQRDRLLGLGKMFVAAETDRQTREDVR